MIEPDDLPRPLTQMQTGVAACMLDGMNDKEAARALGTTCESVCTHRWHMVRMWGLRNPRELLIVLARMT